MDFASVISRLRPWTAALLALAVTGALSVHWFGAQPALLMLILSMPVIVLLGTRLMRDAVLPQRVPRVMAPADLHGLADTYLTEARRTGSVTACIVIELNGFDSVADRGGVWIARVQDILLDRAIHIVRDGDTVTWRPDRRLVVLTRPHPRLTLDSALSLARRLQSVAEDTVTLEGETVSLTACVGVSLSTRLAADADGAGFVAAGERGLERARLVGASAIRAQTGPVAHGAPRSDTAALRDEALEALESGQIQPWFQPQLSTDTGAISGVEALARWLHPEKGTIPPAVFLPTIEQAGALPQLGTVMLEHSCRALKTWEAEGLTVPTVGLNMSGDELSDPTLPERIKWIVDGHGLKPARFSVEILETVALGDPKGVVATTIRTLGQMGFAIELDDFGTGHSAIAALQRYAVHRIKIDRSFVTRIDKDENQRRIVTGILGLAERLGLQTLAEGVESHGENAVLAQLGCTHVQGFRIARPMPAPKLLDWAREHQSRIDALPKLSLRAG